MTSSNTSALTKRSASTALMAPPSRPAPKRIKRPTTILDEETYTSTLSSIIKARFFPGLIQSEAQNEYFDALSSGNQEWISDAGKKLESAMENVRPVMGLDEFYKRYTSEDHESVYKLLDEGNVARFERLVWLHDGNRVSSKREKAVQRVLEARNAVEDEDVKNGMEVAVRPSQDLSKRPAAPTTAPHSAFNSLMFLPEGIEEVRKSRAMIAEEMSLAPPKAIAYCNTRLPAAVEPEISRPTSPTLTAVKAAISGRPKPTASEPGFAGGDTPRVNGYTFVEATEPSSPQPEPKLNLLDKYNVADGSGGKNPFVIKEEGRREKLHFKMVDKINKGSRDDGNGLGVFNGRTPRFGYTPGNRMGQKEREKERGNLTPAGRRLLERVGGGTTPGMRMGGLGGMGFGGRENGSGLANEWTPDRRGKRK